MNISENKITVEKMYTIYASTNVILKIVWLLYMYSLPFSIFKLTGKTEKEKYLSLSKKKYWSCKFQYYERSIWCWSEVIELCEYKIVSYVHSCMNLV